MDIKSQKNDNSNLMDSLLLNSRNQKGPYKLGLQDQFDSSQFIGNYKIIQEIGEGTFGKVKLAIHIPTEEYVALKILERKKLFEKDDLKRVAREITILKKFNHPNIIKIYEVNYYNIIIYRF